MRLKGGRTVDAACEFLLAINDCTSYSIFLVCCYYRYLPEMNASAAVAVMTAMPLFIIRIKY